MRVARRLGGPLRRLRGHARGRRGRLRRLRGRRAAPPAGRRVDRLRLRHRPHGRVRARAPTPPSTRRRCGRRAASCSAAGSSRRAFGFAAADRARLRDRRRRRRVELFLAAVAALGVRARRAGWRGGSCPSRGRARAALLVGLSPPALAHATTVYPELAAGAMLAGAVLCRAAGARAARPGQRGGGRDAARAAAVAGPEVPAPGGAGGDRAGALDGAARAPHGGARGGRDHGRLAGRLRDDQRPPLRRARAVGGGGLGRAADRRGLARRLPRAGRRGWRRCGSTATSACCAGRRCCCSSVFSAWLLWRSRRRTSRAWSAERADAEVAAGLSLLVCGAVAAGRGVRRADAGRRLVPGPPAHRRLPGRRRPRGLGAAARAAHGRGARRAHAAAARCGW